MKKLLTLPFVLLVSATVLFAQTDFTFTDKVSIKTTTVKSQSSTGTCWSYATTSFIETEALRLGNENLDISEMFFVRYAYPKKAVLFSEADKESARFSAGGLAHDVMYIVENYGIVPDSYYTGLQYGTDKHNHGEIDAMLYGMVSSLKNEKRQLSPNAMKSVETVLDNYLGEVPAYFSFNKKNYTPQSFAKEVVGINPADYVEITSYSNHPFYEQFVLDIPDNWFRAAYYNLPIDEFMQVLDNALENGYSIAWDGDVSEKEFSHKIGVATWPAKVWKDKTEEERKNTNLKFEAELVVTQALRQSTFEDETTTDDHLMHLTGTATDSRGTKYYTTKNSWGDRSNKLGGFLYMSEAYVRLKSVSIMVHKDALPNKIAKKLKVE